MLIIEEIFIKGSKMDKKFILPIGLSVVGYFVALSVFSVTQSLLLATIILLVAFWSNEALPLGVTSLLPIILFPLFDILDVKNVTVNYSKTIIFLFLGGFMIAIAVEKINLHKIIANKLISIFPKTARGLIFALSITSATLSSLLSNTTTALLLMPIALYLTEDKSLKIRLVLAIAYGASIGGIITPIGTPPNLILLGFLQDKNLESLTFVAWMAKTIPLAILMLLIVSYILSLGIKEFKIKEFEGEISLNSEQNRLKNILILLIIALFANSFIKISDSIILLGFGLLMFMPKIGFLEWSDTKKIPYEIIFLFGAGFSIAKAFSHTGLANEISQMLLSLTNLSPFILLVIVALIITFTTEITSNTALISVALPIIYALGSNAEINTNLVLMVATICASYAFMLPIATPPNAIAMSSGVLKVKDMAKYGLFFNLIAISLTSIIAYIYW